MIALLVKASLVIVVLLAFYRLFLERESFFLANRVYLLSCLVLASALPFMALPTLIEHQGIISTLIETHQLRAPILEEEPVLSDKDLTRSPTKSNQTLSQSSEETISTIKSQPNSQEGPLEEGMSEPALSGSPRFHARRGMLYWLIRLYIFGVMVFSANLLLQLGLALWKVYRSEDKIEDTDCVIVNRSDKTEPCSFFKYIFINPASYDFETYEQIIAHEKIHVAQWHTLDLLLAEVAAIVLWFNPFIWILRKDVERNIEYQTDYLMLQEGEEFKESYQMNLLKIATYRHPLAITTNYNQSLIKQRILKMNTKKSNPNSYWKYAFVAPTIFVLLLFLNQPNHGNAQNALLITSSSTQIDEDNVDPANVCEKLSDAIHAQDINKIKPLLGAVDLDCIAPNVSEKGFNRDYFVQVAHTPLSAAAKLGNLEIANLLLNAGSDINFHDVYVQSPLMAAAQEGHLDVVKFLAEKGADVDAVSDNHGTALHCAAKGGHLEIVSYLLDQGANINAYIYREGTPLNSAAKNGHREVLALLIDRGALLNSPDSKQVPALTRAGYRGDNQTITLLLKRGADIEPQGDMRSALYAAAMYGHTGTVELLLSKGADINGQTRDGTALMGAAWFGHTETAAFLLSKGAVMDKQGGEWGTALITAAWHGHTETVDLLIAKGADIDLQTNEQSTIANSPAKLEVYTGVEMMLGLGNRDMQSGLGVTALIAAARNGQVKTVELLLSKGADIHLQNDKQGNALIAAARNGRYKTVDLLLSKGAEVNAQNAEQGFALNAAARNGQRKTVEVLLHKGADINARNDRHGSALNAAARNGHLAIVELLVDKGANVNLSSPGEGTALAAAYRNGKHRVVEFLKSKGAKE